MKAPQVHSHRAIYEPRYKGITRRGGKWEAQIRGLNHAGITSSKQGHKILFLGNYSESEEAAKVYDRASYVLYKDPTKLNFALTADEKEELIATTWEEFFVNLKAENAKKTLSRKTSQYRGVSWSSRSNKWETKISENGRKRRIGFYSDESEAAAAYDEALLLRDGPDALTNAAFPQSFSADVIEQRAKLQALRRANAVAAELGSDIFEGAEVLPRSERRTRHTVRRDNSKEPSDDPAAPGKQEDNAVAAPDSAASDSDSNSDSDSDSDSAFSDTGSDTDSEEAGVEHEEAAMDWALDRGVPLDELLTIECVVSNGYQVSPKLQQLVRAFRQAVPRLPKMQQLQQQQQQEEEEPPACHMSLTEWPNPWCKKVELPCQLDVNGEIIGPPLEVLEVHKNTTYLEIGAEYSGVGGNAKQREREQEPNLDLDPESEEGAEGGGKSTSTQHALLGFDDFLGGGVTTPVSAREAGVEGARDPSGDENGGEEGESVNCGAGGADGGCVAAERESSPPPDVMKLLGIFLRTKQARADLDVCAAELQRELRAGTGVEDQTRGWGFEAEVEEDLEGEGSAEEQEGAEEEEEGEGDVGDEEENVAAVEEEAEEETEEEEEVPKEEEEGLETVMGAGYYLAFGRRAEESSDDDTWLSAAEERRLDKWNEGYYNDEDRKRGWTRGAVDFVEKSYGTREYLALQDVLEKEMLPPAFWTNPLDPPRPQKRRRHHAEPQRDLQELLAEE